MTKVLRDTMRATVSSVSRNVLVQLFLIPALVNTASAVEQPCFSNKPNNSYAPNNGVVSSISTAEASTSLALEVFSQKRAVQNLNCPEGFLRLGDACRRQPIPASTIQQAETPSETTVVAAVSSSTTAPKSNGG